MATLSTCSRGFVVTSGLQFCLLNKSADPNKRFDHENETVGKMPDPLPRQDINEVPQPAKENLRILCSAISPCENYIAFADDYKQLTIWRWNSGTAEVSLHKQYNMIRRANKIVFDLKGQSVLAADKSGDVFKFEMDKEEGQCILGHLSMLLDVTLTSNGKYILTCDRDEKIRISAYPNAYNIHNFCLGHTDFVTCIQVMDENHIVSGSGDGSLKSWNYLQGKEVASVTPAKDAGLEPLMTNEEAAENELQVKRTTNWPSILSVVVNDAKNRLAVAVEKYNGLLIYECSESTFKYLKKIETQGPIWEHHFWSPNEVLVVQAQESHQVQIHNLEDETKKPERISIDNDFFKDAMTTPNSASLFVEELHKRWFDNVKEYLEKKREREDNNSEKKKKMKQ